MNNLSDDDFDLRSRTQVKFPQNEYKTKALAISRMLFHQQTSYLVPRYNPIRRIKWPKWWWLWPNVKVKGQRKKWQCLGCYFTYRLHIWYNLIRRIQWSKCQISKKGIKKLNRLYLGCYFTHRPHERKGSCNTCNCSFNFQHMYQVSPKYNTFREIVWLRSVLITTCYWQ